MSNVSLLDDKADNLRFRMAARINDSRWVVGFRVDVERLVVRFSVWLEETVCQVECDIEVTNWFKVALNCYFQSVSFEAPC